MRWHHAPRPRRGAAAAEFALTLPILVLLLLGTLEYGNYFSQLAMVNAVTRDAARYGGNQTTMGTAVTQASTAARVMLTDLGFPCSLPGSCETRTIIIAVNGVRMVQLETGVPYSQLTGVVPNDGPLSFAVPDILRSRSVYPYVGRD